MPNDGMDAQISISSINEVTSDVERYARQADRFGFCLSITKFCQSFGISYKATSLFVFGVTKLKRIKLAILFICLLVTGCQNAADQKRLSSLHEIASETPLYPDFKEISASEGAKSNIADFTTSYHSRARFQDVEKFYIPALNSKGWKLSEVNHAREELVFSKGEYRIAISYKGDQYFVSYRWGNP